MGILEILSVVGTAVAGLALLFVFRERLERPTEPAVPWLAVGIWCGLLGIHVLNAFAVGGFVMDALLSLSPTPQWTFHSPWEPSTDHAGVRLALFAVGWPLLLGLGWLGWTRRVLRAAALTAASIVGNFVFGAIGIGIALLLILPVLMAPQEGDVVWVQPTTSGTAELIASGFIVFGAMGSLLGAGAAVGWVSRATALWLGLLVPALALFLGAVATPPDLLSQWVAAGVIGLGWALGAGTGAAARARV